MKKNVLRIVIVLTLVLNMCFLAFAAERKPRAFDAYAAPVFTLRNVIIYDNIEIMSARDDSRVVLYSGPEVNESTVITSSSQGYINWYVPTSGYYTLTWTDSWGGGWYSY
ncbi:MAG: hypothetical protein ACLUFH_00675 [Monoglobales bacterium]